MKKLISILAALVITTGLASAQEVFVNLGHTNRVFVEHTQATDNANTFGYLEMETGRPTPYVQIFREWKGWEAPVYIHYELRSSFQADESLFLGPTWSTGGPWGFFSLSALGRWDRGDILSPQLSEAWSLGHGITFSGYSDQWYQGTILTYTEIRLHLAMSDQVALGAIVDVFTAGRQVVTWEPRISLRYTLK